MRWESLSTQGQLRTKERPPSVSLQRVCFADTPPDLTEWEFSTLRQLQTPQVVSVGGSEPRACGMRGKLRPCPLSCFLKPGRFPGGAGYSLLWFRLFLSLVHTCSCMCARTLPV